MPLSRACLCAALVFLLSPVAAFAQYGGQSCDQLYYARNSIYKNYGLCFRTARAIRTFGNAGCQYDNPGDLSLSRSDQSNIAAIVEQERYQGCPR